MISHSIYLNSKDLAYQRNTILTAPYSTVGTIMVPYATIMEPYRSIPTAKFARLWVSVIASALFSLSMSRNAVYARMIFVDFIVFYF